MISKAQENLDCAEDLLAWMYYDAAANRAYYAAYQAGWHFLAEKNIPIPTKNGRTYWPHDKILTALEDEGMAPFLGWDREFDYLQQQRVKADYRADKLKQSAIESALPHARRIVEWVRQNA